VISAEQRRHPDPADLALVSTAVRRFQDPRFDAIAVKLFPGEHYVTRSTSEVIVTVLGSCVAACVRDPIAGVGGMNHFMLPESRDGYWGKVSASLRYGNFAMERLINDILVLGGRRERLEVKVFGGANVLGNGANIGHQNSQFIEAYLRAEQLPIAARDLYGDLPRRVYYFPTSGHVSLLELRRRTDIEMLTNEQEYRAALSAKSMAGSVELFE
jgi:chemotaxis protein CheD